MTRPSPLKDAVTDELRKAGAAGLLVPEIGARLGRDHRDDNIATALHRLRVAGMANCWPDPIGRCMNRRRWWLTEHRPEKCPKPSGTIVGLRSIHEQHIGNGWRTKPAKVVERADGLKETKAAPITHDPRYGVDPHKAVPRVVDPGECRSWARAAAEARAT